MGLGSFISFLTRSSTLLFSNRGNVASVNYVFASRDGRSPVGCEEGNQLRDFLRPVGATERDSAQRIHQVLSRCSRVSFPFLCESLYQSRGRLGFGESGRNTV